jgi:hypothetical protein
MLDQTRVFQNVLNEVFFEIFAKSNEGIKDFCRARDFDIDEVKGILFRRETPSVARLTQLVNQAKIT